MGENALDLMSKSGCLTRLWHLEMHLWRKKKQLKENTVQNDVDLRMETNLGQNENLTRLLNYPLLKT